MARKKPIPPGELLPRPLVVRGHIMTMDEDRPEIPQGAMYVDRDGIIKAIQKRSEKAPAGWEPASVVETGGLIFPGLIDLHNHVAYNCLPLWSSRTRPFAWGTRDEWPNDPFYKQDISLPTNALCEADGKAVLKYVETKAVVGGATAIQGSAKTRGASFEGWMVRNVEYDTFHTGEKTVNQSVRPIAPRKKDWAPVHRKLDAPGFSAAKKREDVGNAFLYHLCEGTDRTRLLRDFEGARTGDALLGRFVGIHSTALDDPELRDWQSRTKEASLVWSPFSNLWLYGGTTDVVGARDAGVRICLGSDWSPSGTRNLLGELKVVDLYNSRRLDDAFGPEEICRMATSNPADALGWDLRLGRLRPELHADFVIVAKRSGDPYRALIESTDRDVELVAINGYPMYGTPAMMKAGAAVNPEPITVAGRARMATLRDDRIDGADMSWPEVVAALERARTDPPAALWEAIERERKKNQKLLQLKADKHFDDPEAHPELVNLEAARDQDLIPPLEPIAHDREWFDEVDRGGFHDGLLSDLRSYYPYVSQKRVRRTPRPKPPPPA